MWQLRTAVYSICCYWDAITLWWSISRTSRCLWHLWISSSETIESKCITCERKDLTIQSAPVKIKRMVWISKLSLNIRKSGGLVGELCPRARESCSKGITWNRSTIAGAKMIWRANKAAGSQLAWKTASRCEGGDGTDSSSLRRVNSRYQTWTAEFAAESDPMEESRSA